MTLGKSVFLRLSFLLSMLGIISVPSFADRDLNEITFKATLRITSGNATAIKRKKSEWGLRNSFVCISRNIWNINLIMNTFLVLASSITEDQWEARAPFCSTEGHELSTLSHLCAGLTPRSVCYSASMCCSALFFRRGHTYSIC